jgi:hypothetical protein
MICNVAASPTPSDAPMISNGGHESRSSTAKLRHVDTLCHARGTARRPTSAPTPHDAQAVCPLDSWVLGSCQFRRGDVALVTTHGEAGPVALIATGVLFMLVALGGAVQAATCPA